MSDYPRKRRVSDFRAKRSPLLSEKGTYRCVMMSTIDPHGYSSIERCLTKKEAQSLAAKMRRAFREWKKGRKNGR